MQPCSVCFLFFFFFLNREDIGNACVKRRGGDDCERGCRRGGRVFSRVNGGKREFSKSVANVWRILNEGERGGERTLDEFDTYSRENDPFLIANGWYIFMELDDFYTGSIEVFDREQGEKYWETGNRSDDDDDDRSVGKRNWNWELSLTSSLLGSIFFLLPFSNSNSLTLL